MQARASPKAMIVRAFFYDCVTIAGCFCRRGRDKFAAGFSQKDKIGLVRCHLWRCLMPWIRSSLPAIHEMAVRVPKDEVRWVHIPSTRVEASVEDGQRIFVRRIIQNSDSIVEWVAGMVQVLGPLLLGVKIDHGRKSQ